jgi:hypothetical protein
VPGITTKARNTLNPFATEELDVAFWNEKHRNGFYFLPYSLLVECKNWSEPVDGQTVVYFADRLRARGADHGVLVAARGVTGDPARLTAAHFELTRALGTGIRILVVTRSELEALLDTADLARLLKQKLCELAASGTCIVPH